MSKRVVSKKAVSVPEVKGLLENRPVSPSPLRSRIYQYVSEFSKLEPDDAKALREELMEKFELQDDEACQIVNICPTTVEELRSILSGYKRVVSTLLFSDEKLNAIIEVVKKYVKEG